MQTDIVVTDPVVKKIPLVALNDFSMQTDQPRLVELRLITQFANATLFNIRNEVPIYTQDQSTEVMLLADFKENLLSYMGLEKYTTSEKEWVKL